MQSCMQLREVEPAIDYFLKAWSAINRAAWEKTDSRWQRFYYESMGKALVLVRSGELQRPDETILISTGFIAMSEMVRTANYKGVLAHIEAGLGIMRQWTKSEEENADPKTVQKRAQLIDANFSLYQSLYRAYASLARIPGYTDLAVFPRFSAAACRLLDILVFWIVPVYAQPLIGSQWVETAKPAIISQQLESWADAFSDTVAAHQSVPGTEAQTNKPLRATG